MGWLDKLVVSDDPQSSLKNVPEPSFPKPVDTFQTTQVDTENLVSVEDIYNSFNLTDMSKSIFKVTEFQKALPDALPTDVKRTTVVSILGASGLDLQGLLTDATQRTDALTQIQTAFTAETEETVATAEQQIKDLEAQIDGLKQKINDRKKLQESQISTIQEEVKRIDEIVKFVSPS